MKTVLNLLFLFISSLLISQNSIYFPTDDFMLTEKQKHQLHLLKEQIDLSRPYEMILKGHTDEAGSETYNMKLSAMRNKSVKEYLLSIGFQESMITCEDWGEAKPLMTNSLRINNEKNRRVEVNWNQEKTVIKNPIEELFAMISPSTQKYCINPNRDTTLVCENGTSIYIPLNSFDLDEYEAGECLEIQVLEAIHKEEMFGAGLTTTSNGEILASAGMINIEAYYKGEKVSLNQKNDLLIAMATEFEVPGTELFDGHFNENNQINWTSTGDARFVGMTGLGSGPPNCYLGYNEYCRLFFCKIRRALRINKKKDNAINFWSADESSYCSILTEIIEKYKVNSYEDLFKAFNIETKHRYEVEDWNDLMVAIKQETLREIDEDFENIDFQDLNYYVFRSGDLGYRNCDLFMRYPENDKIAFDVNLSPDVNVDVKLVFKNQKSIISPVGAGNKFTFGGIPEGLEAYVVATKYEDNQPYLYIKEISVSKDDVEIEFRTVSLEELKDELKKLNGENSYYSEN